MTRKQREEELNQLLKTEEGMNQIVQVYHQECPDCAPAEPDPPHGMMVQLILDQEFPPELPGTQSVEGLAAR